MALDKDKQPIQFSRADGARIRQAVRAYERGYQNQAPQRAKYPVGKGPSIRRAVLTTTLTARSGSTPGTGTALLRVFNGTTTSDTTAAVTVRSDFSTSIASGKVIMIAHTDGAWWILTADC